MDQGKKIRRYIDEITPAQLEVLVAVLNLTVAQGEPAPILRSHFRADPYKALVLRQLIVPRDPPPGWNRRNWAVSDITKLGTLVTLRRMEEDLRRLGALPAEINNPE